MLSMWSVLAAGELETIKKAAEQGNAKAQNNLGLMYAQGAGVPEDDAEAVRWYQWAAEQGNAEAQYNLGLMYKLGIGVPEDVTKAVRWYQMAAERGFVKAQYHLGTMYAQGEGVPEDDAKAYAWLSIVAAQGDESAKKNKDIVTERMTRAQIAEAQKLSREYWEAYGPNQENK